MPDARHEICVNIISRKGRFVMTFGGIILLAVTVAVVVIGSKVKKNSERLQDLESNLSKK